MATLDIVNAYLLSVLPWGWLAAVAYLLSLGGGWVIAGAGVYYMRRLIDQRRDFLRWTDVFVGCTERAIATTLVILAPPLLPGFIGGWVALKFAANWQRKVGDDVGPPSLIALVGSAISFAAAIAAGLLSPCSQRLGSDTTRGLVSP